MYNWIADTFAVSEGVARIMSFVVALAVVLALIGLFGFIARRLIGTGPTLNRNRQPRIAVMDAANIDARRRLLLIRRDNVEHLILVGGPSDIVVEQSIMRGVPVSAAFQRQPRGAQQAPVATAIPGAIPSPTDQDLAAQQPGPVQPASQPSAAKASTPASRPDAAQKAGEPEEGQISRPARAQQPEAPALLDAALNPPASEDNPAIPATRQQIRPNPSDSNPNKRFASANSRLAALTGSRLLGKEKAETKAASSAPRTLTPPASGPAAKAKTVFQKGRDKITAAKAVVERNIPAASATQPKEPPKPEQDQEALKQTQPVSGTGTDARPEAQADIASAAAKATATEPPSQSPGNDGQAAAPKLEAGSPAVTPLPSPAATATDKPAATSSAEQKTIATEGMKTAQAASNEKTAATVVRTETSAATRPDSSNSDAATKSPQSETKARAVSASVTAIRKTPAPAQPPAPETAVATAEADKNPATPSNPQPANDTTPARPASVSAAASMSVKSNSSSETAGPGAESMELEMAKLLDEISGQAKK